MVSGLDSVSTTLSSIYDSVGQDLASVMGKIAAGKKYVQPSDDFTSYLRTTSLQNDVTNYTSTQESIKQALVWTDAGQKAGNQVYSDLNQLQNINNDYIAAAGDATLQTSLANSFQALGKQIDAEINNANVDGVNLFTGTLPTVNMDPTATATLTLTPSVAPAAGFGALTAGAGSSATITTGLGDALGFLTDMQSNGKALSNQSSLIDTILASKNAAITAVSGINDAQMLAQETDLQVRQQAAISMMSQANVSRQGILKLYV